MSEQEQKDETKGEHCGSGSDSTGLVIRVYWDIYPPLELVCLMDLDATSDYAIHLPKPKTREQEEVYLEVWKRSKRLWKEWKVDFKRRVDIAAKKYKKIKEDEELAEKWKEERKIDANEVYKINCKAHAEAYRGYSNPYKTKDRSDYVFR